MEIKFDPRRYTGAPAFPPASPEREEDYIEKMIKRDQLYENRDLTIPTGKK